MTGKGPRTSEEIRQAFLDYFEKQQHVVVAASPIIPRGDKTLLFTNAGMNQFKDVLLGVEQRDYKRAASCQTCIRAGGKHNDLDAVGKDGRHNTFFEMLGNWSFGDYFKKEAIEMGWDFVTNVLKMPEELLYASVYKTDDESYDLWTKHIGLAPERVVRLGDLDKGDEENFWSMGPIGPCGPCTEIHFDLGVEAGCGRKDCMVGCDCDRYSEIWNLVFMESNRLEDGSFEALAFKSVDTGMGLERTVGIKQGVTNVFDTDLFQPLVKAVDALATQKRETPQFDKESRCVIADHIRALAFSLAEGGRFSNEGRGYVLRRILRRAMRHGLLIGIEGPFLYKVLDAVVEKMGGIYPHIARAQKQLAQVIKEEEDRFVLTLDRGVHYFEDVAKRTESEGRDIIKGSDVFHLYDTFGFPFDLTEIMAAERKLGIDQAGFDTELAAQRERSKKAAKFYSDDDEGSVAWTEVAGGEGTEFVGYDSLDIDTIVRRYREGPHGLEVVVEKSPLYLEKGGQKSDSGSLTIGAEDFAVRDVLQVGRNTVLLCDKGKLPAIKAKDKISVRVDRGRRDHIRRNHTGTHLLHAALRERLGEDAAQAGSAVDPDYFTFDFRYNRALSEKDLFWLEERVNEAIQANFAVKTQSMSYDAAIDKGAIALFEEQYEDEVRVVSMGDGFSSELCGGTHVKQTGDIGLLLIQSERAISAGVRRITAVTGRGALLAAQTARKQLGELSSKLAVAPEDLSERVANLVDENRRIQKEQARLKKGSALSDVLADIAAKVVAEPVPHFVEVFNDYKVDDLKSISDEIVAQHADKVLLLATGDGSKSSFIIRLPDPLVSKKLSAGKLCKAVAGALDGKGGGKANMASGGVGRTVALDEYKKALAEALADQS